MDEIRRLAQGDPGSAYDCIVRWAGNSTPSRAHVRANKMKIFDAGDAAPARNGYADRNGEPNGRWEMQFNHALDIL